MRTFLLSSFLSLLITASYAQSPLHYGAFSNGISRKKSYHRKAPRPFSVTIRGGLTQFFGELNKQDMLGMAGISVGQAFNKQVALHLDYTAGKLGGEQTAFFNSYFINEYNTLELTAKWDLTEQFSSLEPGPVHFRLYGGVGLIYFSANAFDLDNDKLLRFTNSNLSARNPLFLRWGPPHGPTGIKKTREGMLPLGTSLDYELLRNWRVGIDYRFYFVRTDKMDATSGRRLINPEEGESYSDTPNDKFSFLSVFLTYHFKGLKK
jgi:hypothetical protein